MELIEYLTSLGTTPDEVAASLRKQGVKGTRGSSTGCVLLEGIKDIFSDRDYGLQVLSVDSSLYFAVSSRDDFEPPDFPGPVLEFVRRFDAGDFPDLQVAQEKKS